MGRQKGGWRAARASPELPPVGTPIGMTLGKGSGVTTGEGMVLVYYNLSKVVCFVPCQYAPGLI